MAKMAVGRAPVGPPARVVLAEVQARTTKPVNVWAAVGALILALQIYILVSWLTSSEFGPTPDGATPIPQFMSIAAHAWEGLCVVGFLAFIYWFLVRPLRRERRLTLDGAFVIAFPLVVWQDTLLNYTQPWATYNTAFFNWGSWINEVPGSLWPNGNLLAEPMVTQGQYVAVVLGAMMLANVLMDKAKARWPRLGTLGLIMVCFAFFVVFDVVAELIWMRLGLFAYPGAIRELSLFAGHYYQFPLYEALIWGGTWTAFACLRYFRNDRGQTVAERGIERVQGSGLKREGIRVLALAGVLNVIFLVGYNIPIQYFGAHSDPWPEDIQNRSYLTDGLCGPSTNYACPAPDVPIPRPNSAHIAPDGQLVRPPGVNLRDSSAPATSR